MAQEELELVRADLTRQLEQAQQTAAEERAGLAEQLRQAQRMSEAAKEEGEEQRCKVQEAERQLYGLARENEELRQQLQESEEGTKTEVDTLRLRLELEGLRQLEEVRKQFDVERDWYREQARNLAGEVAEARPSHSTGELHESHESVTGASAPLRGVSSEREEGESLREVSSRPRVTFVDSTGGPETSPPSSLESLITDATNGSSGDRPPPNVISGDAHTSDFHIVASSELVSVENGSVGSGELIQQLSQLVQTQTAMVAAQTRAMSAQSLPPVPIYSGEGEQSLEDGFERWIEQFEERARLAGWSEDLRRYHLKMRLSKTAFQTYRLLPEDVKASYSATVSVLRSKLKPVDIEELRGMEFHQLVQKNQSVEQLGLQLQKVAKRVSQLW